MIIRLASVGAWHEVAQSQFRDFDVAQGLALGVSLRDAVAQSPERLC